MQVDEKRVIVFVNSKRACDIVYKQLDTLGYRCTVLHSGKTQARLSSTLLRCCACLEMTIMPVDGNSPLRLCCYRATQGCTHAHLQRCRILTWRSRGSRASMAVVQASMHTLNLSLDWRRRTSARQAWRASNEECSGRAPRTHPNCQCALGMTGFLRSPEASTYTGTLEPLV